MAVGVAVGVADEQRFEEVWERRLNIKREVWNK